MRLLEVLKDVEHCWLANRLNPPALMNARQPKKKPAQSRLLWLA
jgi:hypothetical protein